VAVKRFGGCANDMLVYTRDKRPTKHREERSKTASPPKSVYAKKDEGSMAGRRGKFRHNDNQEKNRKKRKFWNGPAEVVSERPGPGQRIWSDLPKTEEEDRIKDVAGSRNGGL